MRILEFDLFAISASSKERHDKNCKDKHEECL